jgi:hypothetical protein
MAQRGEPRRSRLPIGSLLVAAAVLGALLVLARPGAAPGGASTVGSSSPSSAPIETQTASPLPSGGLSQEQALSIAQKVAPLSAVFESAQAGSFASVVNDPEVSQGLTITPDHEIWAVRFAAIAAPCPPGGSTCESPRPGTVTVLMDYFSGQLFETVGVYPGPGP